MRIEIVADEKALALRAADILCEAIRRNPHAVIGLPTGDTPKAAYAEFTRLVNNGAIGVGAVRAFAVDEFLGAGSGVSGTNAAFFAAHLDVGFGALRIPDSAADAADSHVARFSEETRAAGSFDLCVLGIGANGHIAFNEPGSARDSRTRVVELTDASRRAHATAFGSLAAVPARGVTLGVGDILKSRAILVMAQGAPKAAIVARAIEGAASPDVPASWLQTHANVTWLLDEAAASQLSIEARRAQPPPAV